jgi:peptide subunit release factor 1 (eRF1)
MLSETALQELLSFEEVEGKVLSLYLNADLSQQTPDAVRLTARGLLRDVNNGSAPDAVRIEQYLEQSHEWSNPGLAVFSCERRGFFRAIPTAVAFRNRLRVGTTPYVKPLAHFLDYYAHYGVILVDRAGARFFIFHLGELQKTGGAVGEDVRKVKLGSGSSAPGVRGSMGAGRYEQELADRNLREIAAEAADFFAQGQIRRLFIGGTSEVLAQFRDQLPKQMQSRVAATFTMDKMAPEHEVREKSLALLTEDNDRRERQLVSNLIAAAASGSNALLGLDEVLQAVVDGRVQTLVLSDGYRHPGYVHRESGFLLANLARSPIAAAELESVADVVDEAVIRTITQGGQIEVISDNPALEEAGRIGAMLRY